MFKSLFIRLMVTYFIIILATLIALSILLSTFFQNYIMTTRTDELIREGDALSPYVELYVLGVIDNKTLVNYFKIIDRFLNTTIWITDELGYIWSSYSSSEIDAEKWKDQKLTVDEFVQVLEGNTIIRVGSFQERFTVPVLTVGMPLKINNKIKGTIFLHSPIREINSTLRDIYVNIWRAAFFSAILSMFLLYFISRRISKPLIQMNMISREIASGNFRRRVKVVTDDEVGQLSVNFNVMADSLEKLEVMRRSFVANVSHELRSPLTSMKGYIQGVLDKTIGLDEQDKYLKIALDETERMNRLINELLDLAQIESGQFSINVAVIDINETIRRILIAHEERINERSMDIEVDFEEEACLVEGDPDRLQQVIINLLDNAIKFNREGGLIYIKTWSHKDSIYVKIMDEGPGMPKEEVVHVWEPFYQIDKSRSQKKDGTGLGLAIVKNIIDEHGQSIWVNSEIGKGTAFIFSLKTAK